MVDASAVAVALADDTATGALARTRFSDDGDLRAPHIVDLEVASFLRRSTFAGWMEGRRAAEALEDLMSMPITRHSHVPLLDRVWELRANVSPYDASYVALAESLECPFVTTDVRLSRVRGLGCSVEVLRAR